MLKNQQDVSKSLFRPKYRDSKVNQTEWNSH